MDTNVLFASLYSASGASYKVLQHLTAGRLQLVLSAPLLFEYEDVLKRNQSLLGLENADIEMVLDNLCELSLRLPDSIHRHIKEIAQKEGVSINQFIASAVAEKVSAIATEEYLQARAQQADKAAFESILAKVAKRQPLPGDEL